ncbi:MAG: radical SAM protein, partial [Deltaproteobacteria bacterium]|nr:radical SAM protein [Deltaproteobacteria bacterium]
HHPAKYRIFRQPAARTAPYLRVSVDYQADVAIVTEILDNLSTPTNDLIIDFLSQRPKLVSAQARRAPAEVSLEKAMLFPEKMQAVRLNNCQTFDESYPISVELSLTNRCNHHCVWCSDAALRRRLPGDLNPDIMQSLFAELKQGGTRGVVIEGGGEPTLHPGLTATVKAAREQNLALGLISNGYLLPSAPPGDFEWIRISLDAATRDQYLALKGVDGFDRVLHNLMTLAADNHRPILGVGYVLTSGNDDPVHLDQLVLFLRQIGLGYIHFRPVIDHPELVSSADLGYLKKFETDTFSVKLSAMTANRDHGNAGLPCLAHSLSAVITADGGVYLCGRLNGSAAWESLGNLHQRGFHEIWTGVTRRQQVGLVSQAQFCKRHCPPCRMTKYNRLLNDVEKIRTRNFI